MAVMDCLSADTGTTADRATSAAAAGSASCRSYTYTLPLAVLCKAPTKRISIVLHLRMPSKQKGGGQRTRSQGISRKTRGT